jgi:phage-related minor tail protein
MPEYRLQFIIDAENRAEAALNQVKGQMEAVQGKLQNMEPAFRKMALAGAAGFTAVTGAVALSVKTFIDAGDQIEKMAIRTGFGTKSLSELKYAADLSGASLESLELATKSMSKFVDNANDEVAKAGKTIGDDFVKQSQAAAEKVSKLTDSLSSARVKLDELTGADKVNENAVAKQTEKVAKLQEELDKAKSAIISIEEPTLKSATSLAKLGLTMEDIKGLSPEETFWKLAEGIASIEEPMTRSAMALEIFGRQGSMMLPLFESGAEGIARMRAEAAEAGIIFDEAGAKKAADFHDALTKLNASIRGVQMALAEAFIPILREALDKITPIIASIKDWTSTHPELARNILIAVGAISGIIAVIGALRMIVNSTIGLFGAFNSVLGLILSPIGLVVIAVGALIACGVALYKNWDSVKNLLKATWDAIKLIFTDTIDKITLAINTWMDTQKARIIDVWNSIKDFFRGVWDGITGIFRDAYNQISGWINELMALVDRVKSALASVGNKIGGTVSNIGNKLFGGFQFGGVVPRTGTYMLHRGEVINPAGEGGSIVVNINGGTYLSEDVAIEIGDMIIEKLKQNRRL